MAKAPAGFVSLKSLKQGPPDPDAAISEIRRIYFKTTRQTIEHDFDHAIDLLKSLPTEEQRERATVYMEGIAQMRKDWGMKKVKSGRSGRSGKSGRSGGGGGRGGRGGGGKT
jgi:uncharacterized membrane protein YgcG